MMRLENVAWYMCHLDFDETCKDRTELDDIHDVRVPASEHRIAFRGLLVVVAVRRMDGSQLQHQMNRL